MDIGGLTVQLGDNNALPSTAAVQVGDPTLGPGVLNLNGYNQTLVGLSSGAGGTANNIFDDYVTNSNPSTSGGGAGGEGSILTVNNSADYDYQGSFTGNLASTSTGPGS